MSQRLRYVKRHVGIKTLQIFIFACGTMLGSWAQAFTLGHARVVSAPGEPMQVVVPLLGVSPEDASSLRVFLADEISWQRAGLQPPTPLASTVVNLDAGSAPDSYILHINSTTAPATSVVDLLLDVIASSGQRQLQVSILLSPRSQGNAISAATVGTPTRQTSAGTMVHVRNGDTLSGIAARNQVGGATRYQMLVALWRANPHAFIQQNMNLLRAGEALTIPDVTAVQAIDETEARRIYSEQVEAYTDYRHRIATMAATSPVLAQPKASSGKASTSNQTLQAPAVSGHDRLRISKGQAKGADKSEAQEDARISTERAMAEIEGRVNELKSNVQVLNKAAALSSTADTGLGNQSSKPAAASSGDDSDESTFHESLASLDALIKHKDSQEGGWWSNKLAFLLIVVIALLALAIAWLLRRANVRRHTQESPYENSVHAAPVQLDKRLEHIDLNLDSPPADAPQSSPPASKT